jgi:N-acetylneuraminic acid mutarotase
MFDFTSGAWTQLASLPLAVRDSGIAVVDGVVYVIGGNAANNLRSPVVESYDPATDTWSLDNPSLQVGRSELSVGVLGSTIIAVDGYSTAAPTGDNETIASAGSQWTTQAPDPIPRSAACSAALGGSFYVAGGMAASHVTDHIHLYKGKKGMWNQPSAKMPVPVAWAVGVASKGMLYCFGGQTQFLQSNSTVGSVQIYKP